MSNHKTSYVFLLALIVPVVLPSKNQVEDNLPHDNLDPIFHSVKTLQEHGNRESSSLLDGWENRKSFHDFLAAEELDVGGNSMEEMGLPREDLDNLQFDESFDEELFIEDGTQDFSEEHSMHAYRESRQREHDDSQEELPDEGSYQDDGYEYEDGSIAMSDEVVYDEGMRSVDRQGNFIQENATDGSEENEQRVVWTVEDSIERDNKHKLARDPDLLLLNPLSNSGYLVVSKLTEANFTEAVFSNEEYYKIISFRKFEKILSKPFSKLAKNYSYNDMSPCDSVPDDGP